MKQRITAMLLSLVLVLSVSAVSFAAGETSEARNAAAESVEAGLQTGDAAKDETSAEGEPSAEGEVSEEGETPVEGETSAESETPAEGETPVEGETAPEEEAPTFRDALDEAVESLERQIRKNKTRLEKRLRPTAFAYEDEDDIHEARRFHAETISDTLLYFASEAQSVIKHKKLLGAY